MPSTEHAPPPPDDAVCDCGGCREFRAIHGGLSPELPLPERLVKRQTDRAAQLRFDESDGHQPTRLAA